MRTSRAGQWEGGGHGSGGAWTGCVCGLGGGWGAGCEGVGGGDRDPMIASLHGGAEGGPVSQMGSGGGGEVWGEEHVSPELAGLRAPCYRFLGI